MKYTKEEYKQAAKEKIEKALALIDEGVKKIFEDDSYKKYLKLTAKFHKYSYNNILLILAQMPEATQVAGFSTWKAYNRHVKKGEKGIMIIAPIPQTFVKVLKDAEGKEEEIITNFNYYKPISVFDISQTEGAEIYRVKDLNLTAAVNNYNELYQTLKNIAPCPVEISEIRYNGVNGYFSKTEGIKIKKDLSESQTIKTLVHEIAHSYMHNNTEERNRNSEEVEAESVAFIICNSLGIDSSDFSFHYIAGWSKDKDLKELKSSLSNISKTANIILSKIEKTLV